MFFEDILFNVTILITLSLLYGLFSRFWQSGEIQKNILTGVLFGTIAVIVMLVPFNYQPGIIFDTRTIVVSVAGLVSGVIPAAIAALISSLYRISIGGVGALAGTASILSAALIGVLAHRYWDGLSAKRRPVFLYLFGLIVTGAMLACQVLLPWPWPIQVIRQIWFPVVLSFPIGTMIVGLLIHQQMRQVRLLDQLAENEARYRSLFENTHAVMLLIEPETGAIRDANPAAATFYGWSIDELRGKNISEINQLSPGEIQQEMERARREEKQYFQFRHRLADGSVRDVEVYSGLIQIQGDALLFSIIHDITEKRQAESRFRQVWESAHDGFRLINAEGIITGVNPAFTEIVQRSREELEGHPLSVMYQGDAEHIIRTHQRRFEERTIPEQLEKEVILQNGDRRWFEVSNTYVQVPGESEQVLAIFRDITERKQAERALYMTQHAVEQAAIGIYRIGHPGGEIISANAFARESLGYSEEELRDMTLFDIDPNFTPEMWLAHRKRIREEGYGTIETVHQRKDGSRFPVEITVSYLHFQGEEYSFSFAKDITQRKQAEQEILRQKQLFETMFNTLPDGIVVTNTQREIQMANAGMEATFGYDPDEIIEQNTSLLYADESQYVNTGEKVFNEHAVDTGSRYITYYQDKHGHVFPGETFGAKLYDDAGRWIGNLGVMRDISERLAMEEALRQSEALQRAMLNTSPVALQSIDTAGNVMLWNEACERIFGWTADEVEGKPLPILPQGRREEHVHLRYRVLQGDIIENYETIRVHKDGTLIPCKLSAAAMYNESGEVFGILGALEDISHQKQAEEVQQTLEVQLRQAQKMEAVGRLAGGVAHDFNNHLTVILGQTEIALMRMDENDKLYNIFQDVYTAAERSADLTRNLLAFARKQTIEPEILDLNAEIENSLSIFRRLIGEDINLLWVPKNVLWPVEMDPSQVDQILANLLVNARDAIDGVGKITIETNNVTFDEEYCREHAGFLPGEYVMIAVSDTGCGMSAETREHIFEPFFTTKPEHEGTGLGLSTIYGILKQNKGFINVYSELDKGTTFKLYLPTTDHVDEITPAHEVQAVAAGVETILVVEDDPGVLKYATMVLEAQGYTVIGAGLPGQALSEIEDADTKIDLMITDVVMPDMNGKELAAAIRELMPDIKLLFISGYTANVIAHHGVLDEGVHFLPKPFSRQSLLQGVREVLDK